MCRWCTHGETVAEPCCVMPTPGELATWRQVWPSEQREQVIGLQLTLPIADIVTPAYDKGLSISERFALFHNANLWVADALEELAADWFAAGHQRVGIKALVEVVRWQYGRTTTDRWKVNNDFTSRYARLLIDRRPEWASSIETRELRAA